jgi:prophage maintenance system killer protein
MIRSLTLVEILDLHRQIIQQSQGAMGIRRSVELSRVKPLFPMAQQS